jgi:hypothetical protein
MTKLEIIGQVISNEYGVLKTGDIVTFSDDMAAMLIAQGAAKRLEVKEAKPEPKAEVKTDKAAKTK